MLAEAIYLHYNHPSVIGWSLHHVPSHSLLTGSPREGTSSCRSEPYRSGEYVPSADPTFNYSLDEELKDIAESIDPSRTVRMTERGQHARSGPGWYYGTWKDMCRIREALPTRLGAQGIAYRAEEWLGEKLGEDFFPPLVPGTDEDIKREWLYHNAQLANLGVYLGRPDGETYTDFGEFAFASQVYQAELARLAIEHFRIRRYDPAGGYLLSPFFQWWPSITWGVLDSEREPLLAFEWISRVNQPLMVAAEIPERILAPGETMEIPVYVVNDRHTVFSGARLEITLTEEEDSLIIRGDPAAWGDSPSYLEVPPDRSILVSTGAQGITAVVASRSVGVEIGADSVGTADTFQFTLPSIPGAVHHYSLILSLAASNGEVLAENRHHFLSVPDPDTFDPPLGLSLYRDGSGFDRHPRFPLTVAVKASGQPCSGCRVELTSRYASPAGTWEETTGPNGNAFFTGLSPGAYTVTVGEPAQHTGRVTINGPSEMTVVYP